MPKTHSSPDTVHRPNNESYSHVVVVEGGRLIFLAGQVGLDRNFDLAGDDVYSQARQAFENIRELLAAHGATPADIVKMNTFVVGNASEHLAALGRARAEVFDLDVPPATTLVGVQSLAIEGLLVEVEAIAVVD